MSCDVITEIWGPLRYSDEVWPEVKKEMEVQEEIKRTSEEQARRAGSILNPSRDGYYESNRFLKVNRFFFFIWFWLLVHNSHPPSLAFWYGLVSNEFRQLGYSCISPC